MPDVEPRATYRLQLTSTFDLHAAAALVPYLARLGVSHVYASPILAARTGSTHGYDVVDPRRVNPELGGDAGRRALVAALGAHGMGLVLDLVPNHMAASRENPFWEDVLAHGHDSDYAPWFDIRWHLHRRLARPRVVLPVLGAPLDEVIARGELRVVQDGNARRLAYWDRSWPIAPESELLLDGPLRAVIDAQHYSLVWWRRGARHANYRRFFDVDDLVAVRQEDPRVFEATHALVLEWIAAREVQGLRIDHVDGLADPTAYLARLAHAASERRGGVPLPIWVEKILSTGERVRRDWPVAGTTGYAFATEADAALLDAAGAMRVRDGWRTLVGRDAPGDDFAGVAFRAKLETMERTFLGEARRLGRLAHDILRRGRRPHGTVRVTRRDGARAVQLLAAALPVYRTYRADAAAPPDAADHVALARALARAVRYEPETAVGVRAVASLLSLAWRPTRPARRVVRDRERRDRTALVRRFQQLTSAAAAKGVEDTALYRWIPLLVRNEVGGDPGQPLGGAVRRMHEGAIARVRHAPGEMLAVSTHDAKRSADVRARLAALSEVPEEWLALAARALRAHDALRVRSGRRVVPDANALYLLFQTLVGIWPETTTSRERSSLCERVSAYARKAAREAKRRTSWTDADETYERALDRIIAHAVCDRQGAPFRRALRALVRRVAPAGRWNALARTTLQLTLAGVPDIYQGDELWSYTLVDPDNRRAVDFTRRAALLTSLERAEATLGRATLATRLLASAEDGRIKLQLTRTLLALRARMPDLFARGDHRPLIASGLGARHAIAFARTHGEHAMVVIVARHAASLSEDGAPPIGDTWGDAALALPSALARRRWRDELSGRTIDGAHDPLPLAHVLAVWPVAVLLSE